MILLIFIMIYPMLMGITIMVINDRSLIPGTANYRRKQLIRQNELNIEQSRASAISARYMAKENEHLDKQLLQIEA